MYRAVRNQRELKEALDEANKILSQKIVLNKQLKDKVKEETLGIQSAAEEAAANLRPITSLLSATAFDEKGKPIRGRDSQGREITSVLDAQYDLKADLLAAMSGVEKQLRPAIADEAGDGRKIAIGEILDTTKQLVNALSDATTIISGAIWFNGTHLRNLLTELVELSTEANNLASAGESAATIERINEKVDKVIIELGNLNNRIVAQTIGQPAPPQGVTPEQVVGTLVDVGGGDSGQAVNNARAVITGQAQAPSSSSEDPSAGEQATETTTKPQDVYAELHELVPPWTSKVAPSQKQKGSPLSLTAQEAADIIANPGIARKAFLESLDARKDESKNKNKLTKEEAKIADRYLWALGETRRYVDLNTSEKTQLKEGTFEPSAPPAVKHVRSTYGEYINTRDDKQLNDYLRFLLDKNGKEVFPEGVNSPKFQALSKKHQEEFLKEYRGLGLNIITDPNQLIMRLPVLIGSLEAGNNAKEVKNELFAVLDALLNSGVITKRQHKQISTKYLR